jgi:aminopeptidase YwaD
MRRAYLLIAISCLLAGVAYEAPAAQRQLPSPELVQALVDEVSGEIAFNYTARIIQFDRIQASHGWNEAAVWIKGELEKMGYRDAVIEGWPSNGSTRYYTYRTPIGWRASRAELWLASPHRERLASFEEMPLTLIKHSAPGKAEAELIDVGTGVGDESYRNKDVRGKIVLATGSPGAVMRDAVIKRGALGMVGWFPPEVRPGYPNMVRYTAVWPTWEERTQIGFGFNVSKLQGWTLKKMLDEGRRVILRAEVEAEFHETEVQALSVTLRGTEEPEKELLIIGHLCHPAPSANDNASGSGAMLEMARALKRMVDKGVIPAPKRTIRFLWIPEFAGTIPYIQAHLERTRNTIAVINCDMIGEDLARTGGLFTITRTPDSMPTFLNDVVVHFTEIVDRLNLRSINGSNNPFAWRVSPYSGGSDHYLFNDGALRVPAVMFGHGDIFHHTSLDTMDKVDSSELRRVSVITLGSMIYMASAGDAEARDMALLVARSGLGRFSENYHDALSTLVAADTPDRLHAAHRHVQEVIAHASWRETESVLSALAFAGTPGTIARVKTIPASIESMAATFRAESEKAYAEASRGLSVKPLPVTPTEGEKALARVVPVRAESFVCPLDSSYLDEKLGAGTASELRLRGTAAYEALNFVDGKRSVTDIRRSVSAALGPIAVEDVHAFFQVLEKAGLVSLRTSPARTAPSGSSSEGTAPQR